MATRQDPLSIDAVSVQDPGGLRPVTPASGYTIHRAPEVMDDRSVSDGVALVVGQAPSLSGEIRGLRRDRLCAAAMFLAVAYTALFFWNRVTRYEDFWFIGATMGLRVVLAATAAVLLYSWVPLTNRQVRVIEFVLFGGLIAILAFSQYIAVSEFLHREDVPGAVAFIKNGIIQVFALMGLYGTFVPNGLKTAIPAILTMAVIPVSAIALVTSAPDLAPVVVRLKQSERIGTNIMYLSIGASLAIYSSYVLGGLRAELFEARRFGHYRLLNKIGSGGMGEVYLAEHRLLKRPCAMKLIKAAYGRDPLALARFEREVRSAAQLSHPNTIEIYDYGQTEDGTFYYVMEYLTGLTLADLVTKFGPLPPGRVNYLLRQVCGGLSQAHNLGIIHRDLKPGNIFIANRGGETDVAKILDFGLVKFTGESPAAALSSVNLVSGTPLYMAPEQATGRRDLDGRADLYALGAVAYFALTGRPPFEGESAFEVMISHARDSAVPPSDLRPGIPSDLEAVCLRCLAKSPEDRYPNAKALCEALSACKCATEWGPNRADAWWNAMMEPG